MCTVDVGDRHRHLEVSLGLELLPSDLHSNQIAAANCCRSRKIYVSVRFRRGAGAVEQAGLENRSGGNSTVGSNPTLSAFQANSFIAQAVHEDNLEWRA